MLASSKAWLLVVTKSIQVWLATCKGFVLVPVDNYARGRHVGVWQSFEKTVAPA